MMECFCQGGVRKVHGPPFKIGIGTEFINLTHDALAVCVAECRDCGERVVTSGDMQRFPKKSSQCFGLVEPDEVLALRKQFPSESFATRPGVEHQHADESVEADFKEQGLLRPEHRLERVLEELRGGRVVLVGMEDGHLLSMIFKKPPYCCTAPRGLAEALELQLRLLRTRVGVNLLHDVDG